MNIFKGFAQIGPLTDNTLGVVAPIGELADMSKTFARDKTQHTHSDFPNETLVGFSYKVADVATQTTDAIAYQCLLAVNWVYTQARLGTFNGTKDSFQQAFITAQGATFDLIDSGAMIPFGMYFAPEYIEIAPFQTSATTSWKIWLADASFFNEYDESLVIPVPPLISPDLFYADYSVVKGLVASIAQTDIIARLSTARGVYPETAIRNDVFTWQDRNDHTLQIDTDWLTVIYGAAGNNLDNVKETIRTYILANSQYTRDQWALVFPDLFTSTEFIITPFWSELAIPEAVRTSGVYSGITSIQTAMTLCHQTCQGVKYTPAQIDQDLCIVPSQFKSLMLAIVGGPENMNGVSLFTQRYPDYINVPTTHVDFGSMTEETRGFVMLLSQMLMYAEDLTLNSGVPSGFNRVIRNGVVYLAASYVKFLYLVTTKFSVDAITAAPVVVVPPSQVN